MTPRILIRLVTTALVAASLLPAQSAPMPTANPKAKPDAKADERVQVRLAEVIAMLEEDDLTEEQRAAAKKKLQEIKAQLRKQEPAKAGGLVAPAAPKVVRAEAQDVAATVPTEVRGRGRVVHVIEGENPESPLQVEVRSPELKVVEVPKHAEIHVVETKGGPAKVVVAPQEPVPPPPPPPAAPKLAKAPKAPRAPKAPDSAPAPAEPETAVIEVEGRPLGGVVRGMRLRRAEAPSDPVEPAEPAEAAEPVEIFVEGQPPEPKQLRLRWQRAAEEQAKRTASSPTWRADAVKAKEAWDEAQAELQAAKAAQAEAKAKAEVHSYDKRVRGQALLGEADVARVRADVARANGQALLGEAEVARVRADALRANGEALRRAASELRVVRTRAVDGQRGDEPAVVRYRQAKAVANDDAEIRALIEEMRAEMKAIRELMQQLRERTDREDERQAHGLFGSGGAAAPAGTSAAGGGHVFGHGSAGFQALPAFPGFGSFPAFGGTGGGAGAAAGGLGGDAPAQVLHGTLNSGATLGGDSSSATSSSCCTTFSSSPASCVSTGGGASCGIGSTTTVGGGAATTTAPKSHAPVLAH